MRNTEILRIRIGLFVLAGLLLVAGTVYGDVLELKNGTILNGRYVGGTAGTIRFETNEGTNVVETSQAVALTFTTLAPATGTSGVPATSAAPQAASSVPQQAKAVTVPAGTVMMVRMMDGISSQNKPGTRFTTTLDADIVIDGVTAVKAGTKIYGTLNSSKQAGRAIGQSTIDIRLTEITIDKGTQLIATSSFTDTGSRSGVKTLGGAAVGAGIGAVVDHHGGAGKGAAIGAGVSLLKKGETVTVPPGALLEFQLTRPLTLNVR
jgi:hypothetical protein